MTTQQQTKLNTFITEGLIVNKQVFVTMKMAQTNRPELSDFMSSYLSECHRNWDGGNIYAEATIDGYVVYEY